MYVCVYIYIYIYIYIYVYLLFNWYSFVILWTLAHQVPLFMGFPRQEYWSGLPFLLQGIFLIQGLNLHFLHGQANSLPLSHQGSPYICGDSTHPPGISLLLLLRSHFGPITASCLRRIHFTLLSHQQNTEPIGCGNVSS